ncbi:MAG TPA: ATP-binding protein, partial [Caulobacteraceae bacterium]|nr:ATP-binding protein [Caulobacteraceae bacterium]
QQDDHGGPAHTEESQYRRLVDAISDYAIYMLDAGGVVSSWNSGARRLKGYTAEEIIGQHFSRFYTEEDRQAGLPQQGLDTARLQGRWQTQGWRVRKDGGRFWAHVTIEPIRDDHGAIIGFAKITRDRTEQHEAQQALEEARQALFQSQKMEAVGQLTGGIAHDFNNLLTVIMGGLDTTQRSIDSNPRAEKALGMARLAAERAVNLTSRLLAFSRRQPLQPVASDLNLLVRRMTELLHQSLGEQIELEGVLYPRLWTVEVDPNQLEAAVLNLAVNARDAMPDGGKLTIETANTYLDETYQETDTEVIPGQYVLLSVADTGTGIPKTMLTRVFEPFFTTKGAEKGTGLGLSMVYGFVKQSGGHVTIYSEPGEGTCVKLYFPRHLGEAGSENGASHHAALGAANGEVVLLVEDNDAVRAFSVMSLTELGYTVLEAGAAEEAMPFLRSDQRIDLLLTDVVLPGRSGRLLADEAAELRPGLKVLYTTGYSRNAIVHQGRLDPGVELLPKPFTYDQLAAHVRRILDAPARRST